MQNVEKETCAVESDVNMNAEDDEKTTSEAESEELFAEKKRGLLDFSDVRTEYSR